MQQIKAIAFVELRLTFLTEGGSDARLHLLPWSCLSEREGTAHLPTGCSLNGRNCREATLACLVLVCKMLNLVGK